MADGPIIAAVDAAIAMLRDCYWWRRLADPDNPWDQATAEAHIHIDGLPAPDPGPDHSLAELTALRPFALVFADPGQPIDTECDINTNGLSLLSGRMLLQIEIPVPEDIASDPRLVGRLMYKQYGRLIQGDDAQPGLWQLSGQPGYLPLTKLQLSGMVRSDQKDAIEIGDFFMAELLLSWGVSR